MKRIGVVLLAALVVNIIHLQVVYSVLGARVEPWALDIWFNLHGPEKAPQDVVIVAMDESSYRVLDLPMDQAWPRRLHAELLTRLSAMGAKRVVMDILFLGPSSDAAADQALANSFKLSPTIIGTESVVKEVGAGSGRYAVEELLEPPEIFSESVETIALAKMTEEFGYIRRFFVARSITTKNIPTLYEAAAGKKAGEAGLPGDRDFVRYYGPPGTIETIPYHQALNPDGQIPKDFFKDRIVFVGLNFLTEVGPAQKDSYRTSFDTVRTMFGVEVQATAAANLLENRWIKRGSAWGEGILVFFIGMILCALTFYLRPIWGGVLLLSSVVLWVVVSFIGVGMGFFVPGIIFVGAILPLCYLGSTFVYYIITYRSQQQVEKAFQFYLSPEMAHQMGSNPNALSLGGSSEYATAMFTDIAGFSAITENMNAADVSKMLNAYFTEVMDAIFEKKGTLIKFIGDAVFALWGAPIKSADHAKLACETALAIQRGVEKFNSSKRFPALHTRIGVHTGPMVVGNLGSERRFDYTAIGDSVNLASRLEGTNKYFGTSTLITDATKRELSGSGYYTVALGTIMVVGKKERVGLHALLEKPLDASVEKNWEEALAAFRARRWDDASKGFQSVAEREPFFKKAVELYLDQIKHFSDAPPPEAWQGEIEFRSK